MGEMDEGHVSGGIGEKFSPTENAGYIFSILNRAIRYDTTGLRRNSFGFRA
jgi:hypothetical protein